MSVIETAFRYFLIYRGLNLHYKDGSKYDYSTYGPLSKGAKPDQFEYSADRFVFIKLANSFQKEEEYVDYLSWRALKQGSLPYFRMLSDEPSIREFKETYLRTKLTMNYHFDLFASNLKLEDLKTNGEDYPKILEMYLAGELHVDFLVVLDRTFNLVKKYLEIFPDDILLQSKMNKYLRYRLVARVAEYEKLSNVLRKVLER